MNQPNEQLKDTAAAYVLGALPELEIQAFRKDMMRDCELGRYVESLESVGDALLASCPKWMYRTRWDGNNGRGPPRPRSRRPRDFTARR